MVDLESLPECDQTWARHKKYSEKIAEYYQGTQFEKYSQRIMNCAESLRFQHVDHKLKLLNAQFCRVRHCPICQWRRSLRWKARAFQRIPDIVQDFPKDRWLFLTLTIKNCPIEDLRETLEWMHISFNRLTRLKVWCARGWIKSTEITKGQDGLAHPHFHCLLMVPASYFSGERYLSHKKWVQLWKQSLKVEYSPLVNVRAVKRTDDPTALIPEILKYQTKVGDLVANPIWLLEMTRQLHGTRAIAVGGILRDYMHKKDEDETREQEIDDKSQAIFNFYWHRKNKLYQEHYS